jgi:hypothetical protein
MDGIDEDNDGASDAEVPKTLWYDNLLFLFRRPPLQDKAEEKYKLSEKAHKEPEILVI